MITRDTDVIVGTLDVTEKLKGAKCKDERGKWQLKERKLKTLENKGAMMNQQAVSTTF